MKNIIGIIISAVVIIGLVYFLSPKNKNTAEIEAGPVVLISKNLEGTSWVFGKNGTLSFADGQYSASVGCNAISGAFNSHEDSVSFETGITTLMACPELQDEEEDLKEILSKTSKYIISDDNLILTGTHASLTLSPLRNVLPIDTKLNISSIKEDLGIVSSSVDEGTFIILGTDGRFSGKSACNSIMGSYQTKEKMISFTDVGSTKVLCSEEENNREQVLIASLSNVSEFMTESNKLIMLSSDGQYKITF